MSWECICDPAGDTHKEDFQAGCHWGTQEMALFCVAGEDTGGWEKPLRADRRREHRTETEATVKTDENTS